VYEARFLQEDGGKYTKIRIFITNIICEQPWQFHTIMSVFVYFVDVQTSLRNWTSSQGLVCFILLYCGMLSLLCIGVFIEMNLSSSTFFSCIRIKIFEVK